jgi:hypothetical protein
MFDGGAARLRPGRLLGNDHVNLERPIGAERTQISRQ